MWGGPFGPFLVPLAHLPGAKSILVLRLLLRVFSSKHLFVVVVTVVVVAEKILTLVVGGHSGHTIELSRPPVKNCTWARTINEPRRVREDRGGSSYISQRILEWGAGCVGVGGGNGQCDEGGSGGWWWLGTEPR